MASTARQISRDPFRFDFRTLARRRGRHGPLAADRSALFPHDDLTARAVASAGLAALFALPLLLLSSLFLAAPLAVPAAIGARLSRSVACARSRSAPARSLHQPRLLVGARRMAHCISLVSDGSALARRACGALHGAALRGGAGLRARDHRDG